MTTGYVYDPIFLKHDDPSHPETAQRLTFIDQALQAEGLWAAMQQIPSRAATEEELTLIHPPSYLDQLQEAANQGRRIYVNPDTYMIEHSYQAATTAAGSLIDLCLAVVDQDVDNGFAITRPPGHHALVNQSMGFCLLGNVALAAKQVQVKRGLDRVAIVDFDVHHGNGTQAMLDDDPSVLFNSSHQYPFYPGTGAKHEIGRGAAKGTKVNFPLPPFVGDQGFEALYTELLVPILHHFRPQLIIVSAGYDAHWLDPLAYLGLSLAGFTWLSQTLINLAQELCAGKIVFVLEGGYHLEVLAYGVCNSIKALLSREDFFDPLGPSYQPEPDLGDYIAEMRQIHQIRD